MTAQADLIRNRRRAVAAPGGGHDRLIRFLLRVLPALIGAITAVMIIAPLAQHGEISFLLDRNKVAVSSERVAVDTATYRGTDSKGRPFSITAGSAVQKTAKVPVVQMRDLVAELGLAEGPARLTAGDGAYNFETETVAVTGPVNFTAADGYRMVTRGVGIDLGSQRVVGAGGVSGAVPTGTFSADRIEADLGERTIALEGNARLRMVPGKLRIPQ